MWMFTKNSFVSIVAHKDRPDCVLVRARRDEDLARLFPDKEKLIETDVYADYFFRLVVSKQELIRQVTRYIEEKLTYPAFKGAQEPDSPSWMDFLYEVWRSGYILQSCHQKGV